MGEKKEQCLRGGCLENEQELLAWFFPFIRSVTHADDFDMDLGEALLFEAEFFGGTWGEIDDAPWDEWSPVV